MDKLVRFIFEKLPALSMLDGLKRKFGRGIMFVATVILGLQSYFPEIPHIGDINAYLTLLLGYLGFEVGNIHAAVKEPKKA